jgi:DNA processing protein
VNPPPGDRAALIALLRRTGLDARGIAERIELHGPRTELAEQLGAGTSLLPEDSGPAIAAAAAELVRWEHTGLRLLTVLDDDYPGNLRLVHDRPAALFAAGDLTLLGDPRAVAVVGSRRASPDGLRRAAGLASELAAAGYAVVSGLAVGIDAAAHRSALAAGGRTIAVIPTGHEHAYPPENASLQHELAATQAVLSPFWPQTRADAESFRRRNRVMSGLSRGTVIVEASPRSGTRVQARLALAHGRPVFLARALLAQAWAAELAARPNVHVIDRTADVLDVMERLQDAPADRPERRD